MKAIIAAIGLTITVTTSTLLALPLPASAGEKDICSNANIQRNLLRSGSIDQGWNTNRLLQHWNKRIRESGFSSGRYVAGIFVTRCDKNLDGTSNLRLYDGLDRKVLELLNYNLQ